MLRIVILKFIALFILVAGTGCAINKDHGQFNISLDHGEISSTTIMRFEAGNEPAVLRKSINGNYEIKLLQRMKIIDLGKIDPPVITATYHIDNKDLIIVNTPNLACMYQYRIYVLDGYQSGMYMINDRAEDCNTRVDFKQTEKSINMVQLSNKPSFLNWTWAANQLTEARYNRLATNEVNKTATPGTAIGHFEGKRPSSNRSALPEKTGSEPKRKKNEVKMAAPAKTNTPRKIDDGNYESVQVSSKPLVPVKLTLRDHK